MSSFGISISSCSKQASQQAKIHTNMSVYLVSTQGLESLTNSKRAPGCNSWPLWTWNLITNLGYRKSTSSMYTKEWTRLHSTEIRISAKWEYLSCHTIIVSNPPTLMRVRHIASCPLLITFLDHHTILSPILRCAVAGDDSTEHLIPSSILGTDRALLPATCNIKHNSATHLKANLRQSLFSRD